MKEFKEYLFEFTHYKPTFLFASAVLAKLVFIVEKYVFSDWEFVGFITVLVAVDTATGLLKAIKAKQLSSRGFERVLIKVIVYSFSLVAVHTTTQFLQTRSDTFTDEILPFIAKYIDSFVATRATKPG